MKNFGDTVRFIHQRNADIMRVFRQKLADADIIRMPEICRQVAESPASRFWVSEERAAIVVSMMESGKQYPCMTETKREMFAEIYRRYKGLRSKYPKKTIIELVSTIVHQPAPKFYFTPRTVGEFIYRIRNGYYNRKEFQYSSHCAEGVSPKKNSPALHKPSRYDPSEARTQNHIILP